MTAVVVPSAQCPVPGALAAAELSKCWFCSQGWHDRHKDCSGDEICACERCEAVSEEVSAEDAGYHRVCESDDWWRKGRVPLVRMQRDLLRYAGVTAQLDEIRHTRMRRYPDIVLQEYAYIVDFDVPRGRGAFEATVYTPRPGLWR